MPGDPADLLAQRAYLAAFEEWLHDPNDHNARRRQNGFEVLLLEADVAPVNRPDTDAGIRRLRENLAIAASAELDELLTVEALAEAERSRDQADRRGAEPTECARPPEPDRWPRCARCGEAFMPRPRGPGRPRKYCDACRYGS